MIKSDRVQHGALREVLLHSLSREKWKFQLGSGQSNKKPAGQLGGKRVSESPTLDRYAGGAFKGIVFFARGQSARILFVSVVAGPRAKSAKINLATGKKWAKKRI